MPDLIETIRAAIKQDGRSLYRIAKDADVSYSVVHRLASKERTDIGLRTASRLCKALGLTLVRVR